MSDQDKFPEEAPIIRIAFTIIQQAITDGATEIRLDPAEPVKRVVLGDQTGLHISYKVNGDLHEVMPLPDYVREPLTERFKLMADIDPTRSDIGQTD